MSVEMLKFKDRDEWLNNRWRIGGSEASATCGMNPYMTNVDLWEIKTGRVIPEDISDKPYVKYGAEAEKHLRELFKLDFPEYLVFYEENNMFLNDKYPWGHYSADGWLRDADLRLGILEIKTTNILQSMQKEKWRDRIPENYYCQLLHGFLIMEADFAVLKGQLKSEYNGIPYLQTKHYIIEREEVEDDIEYLRSSEEAFWRCVTTKRKPSLILPNI